MQKHTTHTTLPVLFLTLSLFCGCTSSEDSANIPTHLHHEKAEYIYRKHDESLFAVPSPEKVPRSAYPWENRQIGDHTKITKEFFRCKGCSLNPCHVVQLEKEIKRNYDCGGIQKHSLPLRDNKEFIYPILIDVINYVQAKTGKRIVITCGHRCPEHNTYVDPTPDNQHSKHQIGAEVAFYVQGMEEQPEVIVRHLQEFYKMTPQYKGKKEYIEFKRYEKEDTNVSTPPWYNKEIFIKLFKKKEGRNFDNRHPYPYISVQVRHDRDLDEKVIYTWDKANRNYHRW